MSLLEKFFDLNVDMEQLNIAWTSGEGEEHYESTPVGAFVFASMGCDGVGYCIVPREGDETLESSPVYTLSPMDFDEGTVVWTAKNFHDFLRLTLLWKSALCTKYTYDGSAAEFKEEINQRKWEIKNWDKPDKKHLKAAIKAIKSILPKKTGKYDYDYFIKNYQDKANHLDLSFKDEVTMRSYKPGCYCHDYSGE